MQKWLFPQARYLRLDGTAFKGISYSGGKDTASSAPLQSCRRSSRCSAVAFLKELPFPRGLLHGASHFISACWSSQTSFLFVHFDSAIFFLCFFFLFFLHEGCILSFKKKKRPPCVFVFSFCFSKMYNNECTSTDWKRTRWTHCGLTH